jgi:hypothetical protein
MSEMLTAYPRSLSRSVHLDPEAICSGVFYEIAALLHLERRGVLPQVDLRRTEHQNWHDQDQLRIKMTFISDALRDAGASSVFWLGLATVLVIAVVGYLVSRQRRGSTPIGDGSRIIHDWTPTGRIDFAGHSSDWGAADAPGLFYLQAEEIRVLVSLSGIERKEIRWRKATLSEAKRVVVAFHRQMTKASGAPPESASSGTMSSGEVAAKGDG